MRGPDDEIGKHAWPSPQINLNADEDCRSQDIAFAPLTRVVWELVAKRLARDAAFRTGEDASKVLPLHLDSQRSVIRQANARTIAKWAPHNVHVGSPWTSAMLAAAA